jgi:hypothetical protein
LKNYKNNFRGVLAAALTACGGGGGGGTTEGGTGGVATLTNQEFAAANLNQLNQADLDANFFGKLTMVKACERLSETTCLRIAMAAADDEGGTAGNTMKIDATVGAGFPVINKWFAIEGAQPGTGVNSYQQTTCDGGTGAGSVASTRIATIANQLTTDLSNGNDADLGNITQAEHDTRETNFKNQAQIDKMAVGKTDCVTNGTADGRKYFRGFEHKTVDSNNDGANDRYFTIGDDGNVIGTGEKLYKLDNVDGCTDDDSLLNGSGTGQTCLQ